MRGSWVLVCLVGCGGGDGSGTPTDARFGVDASPGQAIDARPPRIDAAPGCPATCGEVGTDDCCAAAAVAGGTYNRANDGAAPATVSNFQLDKYEVTVSRFRDYLAEGKGTQAMPPAAGSGAHPSIAGSGWSTDWNQLLPATTALLRQELVCHPSQATFTANAGANERRPINCVSFYLAFAYCADTGGRLPTEAEWNYAAAGGSEGRLYPWGSTIDDAHASFLDVPPKLCFGDGVNGCAVTDLIRAGTKPLGVGKYGQFELAGNAREWTLDVYAAAFPTPCVDCANLAAGTMRVARGGAYNDASSILTTATRLPVVPKPASSDAVKLGFRCARVSP